MNFKRGGRVTSERLNTSHTIYFLLVVVVAVVHKRAVGPLLLGIPWKRCHKRISLSSVSYVLRHGDSFQHNLGK